MRSKARLFLRGYSFTLPAIDSTQVGGITVFSKLACLQLFYTLVLFVYQFFSRKYDNAFIVMCNVLLWIYEKGTWSCADSVVLAHSNKSWIPSASRSHTKPNLLYFLFQITSFPKISWTFKTFCQFCWQKYRQTEAICAFSAMCVQCRV